MQISYKILNLHFQQEPEVALVTSNDIDVIRRAHLLELAIDLCVITELISQAKLGLLGDDFIFMR